MRRSEKLNFNGQTGELEGYEIHTIKNVRADEFMQVYLQDMSGLMNIKSGTEIKILIWLWKMSQYIDGEPNDLGNYVKVDKHLKDRVCKEINIKEGSFRNIICKLAKDNLIVKSKDYNGIYYLNPKYFFKGSLSDREKIKRYRKIIEYQIKPNIDFKNQQPE